MSIYLVATVYRGAELVVKGERERGEQSPVTPSNKGADNPVRSTRLKNSYLEKAECAK